jgi:hypothetical protein
MENQASAPSAQPAVGHYPQQPMQKSNNNSGAKKKR